MAPYARAARKPRRKSTVVGTVGGVSGAGGPRFATNTGLDAVYAPGSPINQAPAGPPVDPALEAARNAARTNIALGNAWDTYQTGQIGAAYGNLDNPAADLASNPYSQAALKLQAYNRQKAGTLNASGNQYYSGGYQTQVESDLGAYNRDLDALKKSRQAALDELLKGKLDRYSQTGAALDQNTLASLLKALGA